MNKKAQQQYNVGTMFIGLGLFALLLIGGFNFYFGFIAANDGTIPDGIDQTDFTNNFARFDSQFENTSTTIDETKDDIPVIGGLLDFFASGIDSIKTAWNSIGFMKDYVNVVRTTKPFDTFLPEQWWNIVISIFTIVLVLIGISAFWRYNVVK